MQVKFVLDQIDLDDFGSSMGKEQENHETKQNKKKPASSKTDGLSIILCNKGKQRNKENRKPFTLRQKQ